MSIKHVLLFAFAFLGFCATAQKAKTVYIADRLVVCDSNSCLQLKEKKKEAWRTSADTIAGLQYKEGFEYKVKVLAMGTKYSLIKVLSQKKTAYSPASRLDGKKWVLISMHDNGYVISNPDTGIFIKINTAENRFSGHAYCNGFKGAVKPNGNSITFSEVGFTRMKCEEDKDMMDKVVQNLLEATDTFHFKGNRLMLTAAKGSKLVFEVR